MAELGHSNPHLPAPSATEAGTTSDNPGAVAASRVVKNAPGKAFRLTMFNGNAAARFFQVFDAAALPAEATVPLLSKSVAVGDSFTFDFGIYGRTFAVGIVVCNSTTGPTKTIGAADSLFDSSIV